MSQDIRIVLHSAYTFVRSIEENKSIAALTLDAMIQKQINALKQGTTTDIVDGQGNSVGARPSRYDQLDDLLNQVNAAVQAISQAGSDPSKLEALGIFEGDQPTVANSSQSTQSSSATAPTL